jgi:hypothetical protein
MERAVGGGAEGVRERSRDFRIDGRRHAAELLANPVSDTAVLPLRRAAITARNQE